MPAVYERAFQVRYDECDAYGHVNHANYLRYMQEAAFDASADVGYNFAAYDAMNRYWLVRETDITFLRPLVYIDTVIVKTWVADFRRVRSCRMYELRLMATGELVATAHTDWVFLNLTTQRPVSIPPQMVTAFMPDGLSSALPERERFPKPPAPPPGVFRARRRVKWRDIDRAQHVNNTTYLSYLEDCGIEFVRQEGWPVERMISAGFGIIVRRYRIEYKQPALMDDQLKIATWVSDMKRATAVRHYTVSRISDGQLLARARALWVWVDLKTGKPIRIPSDFKKDLADNIVQDRA
jgi:acyl-CoA thioester hydrolase